MLHAPAPCPTAATVGRPFRLEASRPLPLRWHVARPGRVRMPQFTLVKFNVVAMHVALHDAVRACACMPPTPVSRVEDEGKRCVGVRNHDEHGVRMSVCLQQFGPCWNARTSVGARLHTDKQPRWVAFFYGGSSS